MASLNMEAADRRKNLNSRVKTHIIQENIIVQSKSCLQIDQMLLIQMHHYAGNAVALGSQNTAVSLMQSPPRNALQRHCNNNMGYI